MTSNIDLTADTADLAEALIPHLAGVDHAALYSDAIETSDGLYCDDDVLPCDGEDIVCGSLSRAANESDTHFAFRLALAWERI